MSEIKKISKDVETAVDDLMTKDEATQDKYLSKIFEDNEFLSKAISSYTAYISRKENYSQYRSKFVESYQEEYVFLIN
jgi:DNA-binding phage protein